jgi:hypothetical protein
MGCEKQAEAADMRCRPRLVRYDKSLCNEKGLV